MTLYWRIKFTILFCILYFFLTRWLANLVKTSSHLLEVVLLVTCAFVCVVLAGLLASKTTQTEKPNVQFCAILTSLFCVPGVEVDALILEQLHIMPHGANTLPPKAWLQGLPMFHPLSHSVKSLILQCSNEDLSEFVPDKIQEHQIAISDMLGRLCKTEH